MSIRKVQESTSHAARKRAITDYPKATWKPQQRKPPRSLLAALTARRAACMTAHGAHCSPGGKP